MHGEVAHRNFFVETKGSKVLCQHLNYLAGLLRCSQKYETPIMPYKFTIREALMQLHMSRYACGGCVWYSVL